MAGQEDDYLNYRKEEEEENIKTDGERQKEGCKAYEKKVQGRGSVGLGLASLSFNFGHRYFDFGGREGPCFFYMALWALPYSKRTARPAVSSRPQSTAPKLPLCGEVLPALRCSSVLSSP